MRTGPASSAFANIVAVAAIGGQRNEQGRANQQQRQYKPPAPAIDPRPGALHEGATVAPGQLLLAQSAGRTEPAMTHRQGVAAYPSLSSAYQVISGPGPLSQPHNPAPGATMLDFEI